MSLFTAHVYHSIVSPVSFTRQDQTVTISTINCSHTFSVGIELLVYCVSLYSYLPHCTVAAMLFSLPLRLAGLV